MDEEELLDELREFAAEDTDVDDEEETEEEIDVDALQAELESYKADATAARQFRADPVGSLNRIAAELGYKIEPSAGAARPATSQGGDYDALVSEAVNEAFQGSEDLAFLKPQFTGALSKAFGKVIKPLEEMTQREKQATRQAAIQAVESQMDQEYPGWREHNAEMQEIGNWLRAALNGGDIHHPKYGNIYKAAYAIATGEGKATAAAARRMAGAGRNKTRTGGSGTHKPNITEKIKKAPNRDEQISTALDAALAELGL